MRVSRAEGGVIIQVNLVGLVVACVALVVAAALVAYSLSRPNNGRRPPSPGEATGGDLASAALANANPELPPAVIPPWGELIAHDIELEQPEEYVAFEIGTNRIPAWAFAGMAPDVVRSLMLACGVPPEQVARALLPQFTQVTASNTVIYPDDEMILALLPQTRARLYGKLGRDRTNHYMRFPFCYPGKSFETLFEESKVDPGITELVKRLLYPRGDAQCFSDYEMVVRRVPAEENRLELIKTLTRQIAVLPRLRIRRDTDIDKVLGYWGRGVQVKDVRPLLESLKRLPEGGVANILYLLPPFARQRLYTFPVPSERKDSLESCHWSTMNFFNETPDDRFASSDFISKHLTANYYQVARPTLYGDIIFLLDDRGEAIHSAVFIADDIVFTKNGNNYAQPWMLMHLKDLVAVYTMDNPPQVVVYRNKST
jgi:hypothetical protein